MFSTSKTFEDELSTLARFYTWLDESKVSALPLLPRFRALSLLLRELLSALCCFTQVITLPTVLAARFALVSTRIHV